MLVARHGGSAFVPILRILPVLALLLVTSCVRLVEDYDEVLDKGLSEYYEITDKFLLRMAAAPLAEATYGSKETREFYAQTKAKLSGLLARAEAYDTKKKCEGIEAVGFLGRQVRDRARDNRIQIPLDDINQVVDNTAKANCTVQILTVLFRNHEIMEEIHKRNKVLAPVVIRILRPTIHQGVRIALANEAAKKRGERSK
jgi:hypothetical protein